MQLRDDELLKRLGSGEPIAAVCRSAGIDRGQFDRWWQETIEARVRPVGDERITAVGAEVEIQRDRLGIPHIYAQDDADLLFGLGYAMGQDRLFQLDYLRRKGLGRLAEILGPEGLELDKIARTVGLNRIAAAEWDRLTAEVQQALESFASGVNAAIESCRDRWPIEFDLLDYRPEPWRPIDCLAIENEFRWYLTGRFPVIVMPELAKRALGDGPLYEEYLLGEADDEPIVHPGEYTPRADEEQRLESIGQVAGDPEAATGSNNWVISGRRTTTGLPLLASDPHIAFEAVSCWYQAHLCGGSFNVAGMAYVGIPAIMFGRNERVAWGITNNICSLRDLYQEKTDPAHPGCFFYDGRWEKARELVEVIEVRGSEPVSTTIRFSRNGPVVDQILPPPADQTGPVTLKWLGAHEGGWLTSLLAMDRAKNVDEFRESLRPWHVPTFSLVIADVEGRIAFQAAGRIPVRKSIERGYRPGWDPEHQWQGLIPFESMPHVLDPERGWIASANNRLAPNDYPYPLFGCWSSGWRAVRIRQMIEAQQRVSPDDMRSMHQDAKSLRAAELVPLITAALESNEDARVCEALGYLRSWDACVEPESVAATIFNVFFSQWCTVVAAERFADEAVELMSNGVGSCAGRLLRCDAVGWFSHGTCQQRMHDTFRQTIDWLTEHFGADMSRWTWGQFHRMPLRHVLSARGDLDQLLDHGNVAVRGDMTTVCNTGYGPGGIASTGAGYRQIADLSVSPPELQAIDAQSQSGHPGSPHYRDQLETWLAGGYHKIQLNRHVPSV